MEASVETYDALCSNLGERSLPWVIIDTDMSVILTVDGCYCSPSTSSSQIV